MGQKTNPIIFRAGKTKKWKLKYFEKKTTEAAVYAFQTMQIKKFIENFCYKHGLMLQNCIINYLKDNSLQIFISYYITVISSNIINKISKNQKVKLIKRARPIKHIRFLKRLRKGVRTYALYNLMTYNKVLNKAVQRKNFKKVKNKLLLEREIRKKRRISIMKYYKQNLAVQKLKNINKIKINSFLNLLCESLHTFLNRKIKIYLTVKQINKDIKKNVDKKKRKLLKKELSQLRKYEKNEFFRKGITILFITATRQNAAELLANYVSEQLAKQKRHNFFLRFLVAALSIFTNSLFSKIKGIKIKIKGRLNGARRARRKIFNIGQGVSVLSINSSIDYAERTSHTSNGSLGVKIWILENKSCNSK